LNLKSVKFPCGDKLNNAEEAVNKILSEDGQLKDFHIENA